MGLKAARTPWAPTPTVFDTSNGLSALTNTRLIDQWGRTQVGIPAGLTDGSVGQL